MSLGRNTTKLLTSKVASQVVILVTAPIAARLFSPGDFGLRQIFMSIATVIVGISCLRYELSISLAKSEKEASISFTLSMFFTIIFAIVVLVSTMVLRERIARWFGEPKLAYFLWLLPVAVFIRSLRMCLRYWAAREEQFGVVAWSDFAASLFRRLVTITWALGISASVYGLFAGYFAAIAVGILVLLMLIGRKLLADIGNSHLSFGLVWTFAKQHRKLPIFSTWSALLNTFSRQFPPVILGLYFSKSVVGHYSLGYGIVNLPMAMLGSSLAQVFFPAAAKEYNETGELSNIVSNMFRRLAQIGVFPLLVLGFLGTPLFGFVFGEKWFEAGVYMQILSCYLIPQLMLSPLSTVFTILRRQGALLMCNAGLASAGLLGLLLGARTGRPVMALAAYSVFSLIVYSFMLGWVLHNSEVSLRWGAKTFMKYALLSCLLLLPAACLIHVWRTRPVILGVTGLVTAIYIYGLYRFDPGIGKALDKLMNKNSKLRTIEQV